MSGPLRRVVYAPKAYVFIYSRKTGETVDVSNDVSAGSVQRLINQPSKANITLRNDDWKYTGKFNPMFYPMDGITIWLQRYAGRPVQVFTGFIDSIPYFQAYPGEIEITATCTLKQFLYSHFDPGVGFLNWLAEKGWVPRGNGNLDAFYNPEALGTGNQDSGNVPRDAGMGQLLHDFLIEIGNVDAAGIAIGDLPQDLPSTMLTAFNKKFKASKSAQEGMLAAIKNFVSVDVTHTADGASDVGSSTITGISGKADVAEMNHLIKSIGLSNTTRKPTELQMILAALVMSGLEKDFKNTDSHSPSRGYGYFADPNLNIKPGPRDRESKAKTPEYQGKNFCTIWSYVLSNNPTYSVVMGGGLSDEQIAEVAVVLSYGYDKPKFYSQILQACRDPKNLDVAQKVLNNMKENKSFEDLRSLDVITASEVQEELGTTRVTWDSMFPKNAKPSGSEVVKLSGNGKTFGDNGKEAGDVTVLGLDKTYATKFTPYSPGTDTVTELPKIKKIPLKYSEIKYYVYASSLPQPNGSVIKPRFKEASKLKVGDIVLITDPSTEKSCKCVYLGTRLSGDSKAMFTLSDHTVLDLGFSKFKNDEAIYDLNFKITGDQIPSASDNGKSASDSRDAYVDELSTVLGHQADTVENSYQDMKINQSDIDLYHKHYDKVSEGGFFQNKYKGTSQRLAEWFYIASRYDLHFLDRDVPNTETKENDRIYLKDNGATADRILSFLKNTGIISASSTEDKISPNAIANSIARRIVFTFNGILQWQIVFNENVPVITSKTLNTNDFFVSELKNQSYSMVIEANETFPKPVHNGEIVRSPDTQKQDNPDDNAQSGFQPTWSDLAKVSTAAAFTTITAFPFDLIGSSFLIGEKSLMNDVPVMQGIDQLCKGSMRHYMSLPNGMFCAFYPDHFGTFGREPYLEISDIDVIDFNIVLNDEPIVTHMYVNGNTINPLKNSVDQLDQVNSVGVITIDDVFSNNGLNIIGEPDAATGLSGDNEPDNFDPENAAAPDYPQYYDSMSKDALDFIGTYGARPKIMNEPLIRSPWFEFATAYNLFLYNWSMHTATTVQLAFMPEIIAGGIVHFSDQKINMYVEGVTHSWNYSSGFETSAYLSAPSTTATEGQRPPGLVIYKGAFVDEDKSNG
jgi:hypothetical protein